MKARLISQDEYDKTFKDESEVTKDAIDASLRNHGKEFKRLVADKTYKNGEVVK
jgi:hypothetical protein